VPGRGTVLLTILEGAFGLYLSVGVISDPRTVFLTVSECPLHIPRCLPGEGNHTEVLVEKSITLIQVIPRLPRCK